MKFKVGDVVERVIGEWNGMKVGDTGTVIEIDTTGVILKEWNGLGSHSESSLELKTAEEPERSGELKTLYIYEVVIVDKSKRTVIVDARVVASDSAAAIAEVAIRFAKEIAGKDVYTYSNAKVNFQVDDNG